MTRNSDIDCEDIFGCTHEPETPILAEDGEEIDHWVCRCGRRVPAPKPAPEPTDPFDHVSIHRGTQRPDRQHARDSLLEHVAAPGDWCLCRFTPGEGKEWGWPLRRKAGALIWSMDAPVATFTTAEAAQAAQEQPAPKNCRDIPARVDSVLWHAILHSYFDSSWCELYRGKSLRDAMCGFGLAVLAVERANSDRKGYLEAILEGVIALADVLPAGLPAVALPPGEQLARALEGR
jgi:hypothetical protein